MSEKKQKTETPLLSVFKCVKKCYCCKIYEAGETAFFAADFSNPNFVLVDGAKPDTKPDMPGN